MKFNIVSRGSAVAGMGRYDFNVRAETVQEVSDLNVLYDYQSEGLELRLNRDHTGFTIIVGKHPDNTPPLPPAGSIRT